MIMDKQNKNRLSKILASLGVASRRAAEALIFDGRVSVNGEVVLLPQTFVNPLKDLIQVDGKRIRQKVDKVYYMLNKPQGYVCTNRRLGASRLVIDLFPENSERLFTVGRLD